MPDFDKTRLKRENVRREDGERIRVTLPSNHPIGPSTPAVAVNKERVIRVAEQELSLNAFNEYRLDGAFALALHKVEGRVGLVE